VSSRQVGLQPHVSGIEKRDALARQHGNPGSSTAEAKPADFCPNASGLAQADWLYFKRLTFCHDEANFRVAIVAKRGMRMMYLVLKSLMSGIIIMVVSEIAKRSPAFGALVASLPLVSLLAIIWLWRDTGDTTRIANHAEATFWYVIPSLPMFLAFPYMLRHGVGFWWGLLAACVLTIVLYAATIFIAARFGVRL